MAEIDTNEVYKQLKKQNGERVARVIRDAVLLDVPKIVHILEFAGHDPEDVKKLVPIIRETYKKERETKYHSDKNPLELLSDAGYDAFVVKTEAQKNSIKKYYRFDEELCTFNDPQRHKEFYIIHAVKRGADKIKPAKQPDRQDEYGTSVISIQIDKTGGFISIKNRYNHTVMNPDATFNNNPDGIIPGLSDSLKKYFHVSFNATNAHLPWYFFMVNDQLVRYSCEEDNVYFGPGYYFSGSTITKLNKDHQIMMDYMILDTKSKKISSPVDNDTVKLFKRVFDGKTIKVTSDKISTVITTDDGNRVVVSNGEITELELPHVEKIGDNFLTYNRVLKSLKIPMVKTIGNYFLEYNAALKSLDIPSVKKIGDGFLFDNNTVTRINLPNVTRVGCDFLRNSTVLTQVNMPKIRRAGPDFLVMSEDKFQNLVDSLSMRKRIVAAFNEGIKRILQQNTYNRSQGDIER